MATKKQTNKPVGAFEITAKEFRMGNYFKQGVIEVITASSVYCTVEKKPSPQFTARFDSYYIFKEVEPISITAGILLDLGFLSNGMGLHSPNTKLYYYLSTSKFIIVKGNVELDVQFVHQLQNLYFDLYGIWLS